MQPRARHCGLDFGTSNSTVAVAVGGGEPWLLPVENGEPTIPTTVFFDFEKDGRLFGREAIAAYVAGTDGRMMRSLKSVLGRSLAEEAARIKRQLIPFLDIIGMFVAAVKARAEAASGGALDSVVVGRPAHFVDGDPAADSEAQAQLEAAVRAQGFRHVCFQFEPIAAALDYERTIAREELGLVVDLGGGTSDFSVVRVSPEGSRRSDRREDILATTGVHVGGNDFDRLLSLASAMPELGYRTSTRDGKRPLPSAPYVDLATWHHINRLYTPEVLRELRQTMREANEPEKVARMIAVITHRDGHRLAGAVEAAKIALTEDTEAQLCFHGENIDLATRISRTAFSEAVAASINRVETAIGRALKMAGVPSGRLDTLILTGGSTRIPAILAKLKASFPEARLVETDAFGSVGRGLSLEAARRFG